MITIERGAFQVFRFLNNDIIRCLTTPIFLFNLQDLQSSRLDQKSLFRNCARNAFNYIYCLRARREMFCWFCWEMFELIPVWEAINWNIKREKVRSGYEWIKSKAREIYIFSIKYHVKYSQIAISLRLWWLGDLGCVGIILTATLRSARAVQGVTVIIPIEFEKSVKRLQVSVKS